MEELKIGIGLLVGWVMGGGMVYFWQKNQLSGLIWPLREEITRLREQLESKIQELGKSEIENQQLFDEMDRVKASENRLNRELGMVQTELSKEREAASERLKLLEDSKKQMKEEFENLAQSILEVKSKRFTVQNQENLQNLLKPFREQMGEFKKKIEDVYVQESKDRSALHHEIRLLKELNQQISTDAVNLTQALRGQSKTQGIWGEVVLERILEESGLTKEREYFVQGTFKDEEGRMLRPDVVVQLPGQRCVIIDSKVTLSAYERYVSEEDEERKSQHLKEHLNSVRNHFRGLSKKSYEQLEGVQSLDYVLMFMPVEGAFMLLIENDRSLFAEAYEKNVMIVSPSTLLMTLKTIQNIWRLEYQNLNAQEIARSAGDLYDKFVGFVEDMDKVGYQIGKTQEHYDQAMKKLKTGRGNLIKRSSDLLKLGVKGKKSLPNHIEEEAESGDNDD